MRKTLACVCVIALLPTGVLCQAPGGPASSPEPSWLSRSIASAIAAVPLDPPALPSGCARPARLLRRRSHRRGHDLPCASTGWRRPRRGPCEPGCVRMTHSPAARSSEGHMRAERSRIVMALRLATPYGLRGLACNASIWLLEYPVEEGGPWHTIRGVVTARASGCRLGQPLESRLIHADRRHV
jgi:hypothetical protein